MSKNTAVSKNKVLVVTWPETLLQRVKRSG